MKKIKEKIFKDLFEILQPSDKVIELGSHYGYLTKRIADITETVYTYEMDTNTYNILLNNIHTYDNIIAYNSTIVHDKYNTYYKFKPKGKNYKNVEELDQWHSIIKRKTWAPSDDILYNTTDFIDLLNINANVLVMDIEGAEIEILQKYHTEIYNKFDVVCFEYHQRTRQNLNMFFDTILNYTNFKYCYSIKNILFYKVRNRLSFFNGTTVITLSKNRTIPNGKPFNILEQYNKNLRHIS